MSLAFTVLIDNYGTSLKNMKVQTESSHTFEEVVRLKTAIRWAHEQGILAGTMAGLQYLCSFAKCLPICLASKQDALDSTH